LEILLLERSDDEFYDSVLKSIHSIIENIKKTNTSSNTIKDFISSPFLDHYVFILVASDSWVCSSYEILIEIILIDEKVSSSNLEILLQHNLMLIFINKIIKLDKKDEKDCFNEIHPLHLLFYIVLEGSLTSLPNHPNKHFSSFENTLQEKQAGENRFLDVN
jgi:hypothetical protein